MIRSISNQHTKLDSNNQIIGFDVKGGDISLQEIQDSSQQNITVIDNKKNEQYSIIKQEKGQSHPNRKKEVNNGNNHQGLAGNDQQYQRMRQQINNMINKYEDKQQQTRSQPIIPIKVIHVDPSAGGTSKCSQGEAITTNRQNQSIDKQQQDSIFSEVFRKQLSQHIVKNIIYKKKKAKKKASGYTNIEAAKFYFIESERSYEKQTEHQSLINRLEIQAKYIKRRYRSNREREKAYKNILQEESVGKYIPTNSSNYVATENDASNVNQSINQNEQYRNKSLDSSNISTIISNCTYLDQNSKQQLQLPQIKEELNDKDGGIIPKPIRHSSTNRKKLMSGASYQISKYQIIQKYKDDNKKASYLQLEAQNFDLDNKFNIIGTDSITNSKTSVKNNKKISLQIKSNNQLQQIQQSVSKSRSCEQDQLQSFVEQGRAESKHLTKKNKSISALNKSKILQGSEKINNNNNSKLHNQLNDSNELQSLLEQNNNNIKKIKHHQQAASSQQLQNFKNDGNIDQTFFPNIKMILKKQKNDDIVHKQQQQQQAPTNKTDETSNQSPSPLKKFFGRYKGKLARQEVQPTIEKSQLLDVVTEFNSMPVSQQAGGQLQKINIITKFGQLDNLTTVYLDLQVCQDENQNLKKSMNFKEIWRHKSSPQNQQANQITYIVNQNQILNDQSLISFSEVTDIQSQTGQLKYIALLHFLNEKYEFYQECNPSLLIFTYPILYRGEESSQLVYETEYFSTLDKAIEERSQQKKPWSEDELLYLMYAVIDSLHELRKFNLCHCNITPESIVFSYKTMKYKLVNLHAAHIYTSQAKYMEYPLYQVTPYVPPELKDFYFMEQHKKKNQHYNLIASDMYSVGICFLFAKYLVTEKNRNQESILQFLNQLQNDQKYSLSALIICSLINPNFAARVSKTYSNLMETIKSDLQPKNKFKEFQILDTPVVQKLAPFSKQHWRMSSSQEDLADYYSKIFLWMHCSDVYSQMLDNALLTQVAEEQGQNAIQNQQQQISNQNLKQQQIQQQRKQYISQIKEVSASADYHEFKQKFFRNPQEKQLTPEQQLIKYQLRIVNKLWKSLYKCKQYQKALKFNSEYFRLKTLLKEDPDANFAKDLIISGQFKWMMTKESEAFQDYEQALQISCIVHGVEHFSTLKLKNNLAVLYSKVKQFEKSQQYFKEIIVTQKQMNVRNDFYEMVIENLAGVLSENEKYQQALPYLQESVNLKSQKCQTSYQLAFANYKLSNIYKHLNQLDKAKESLYSAIKILQIIKGPSELQLLQWKIYLADILFEMKDSKKALDLLYELIDKNQYDSCGNKQNGNTSEILQIYIDAANMIQGRGFPSEAQQFFNAAKQVAIKQKNAQVELIKNLETNLQKIQSNDNNKHN